MKQQSKATLLRRLDKLNREREQIVAVLREHHGMHGYPIGAPPDTVREMSPVVSSPYSLQGKVINLTIEMIEQLKRPVKSAEILARTKKKNIDLGHYPKMLLAAILGQEVNKKSARLTRVARGLYDLRRNPIYYPIIQER